MHVVPNSGKQLGLVGVAIQKFICFCNPVSASVLEHISIECRKTKTEAITVANQRNGKYHTESMRTQRVHKQPQ